MKHKKTNFLQDIYLQHLKTINGVIFTLREVDIIAFFISGRGVKKVAYFFSISPKTVENHTHNIMLKLGCNSRERIIDFIEKSDKLPILRAYYITLWAQAAFDKCLKDISKIKNEEHITCVIAYVSDTSSLSFFIYYLESSLKLAGINISFKICNRSQLTQGICKENPVIYILPKNWRNHNVEEEESHLFSANESCVLFYLPKRESPLEIFQNFEEINPLNFADQKKYYFLIFDILKRLLPNFDLEKNISEFNNQSGGMEGLTEFKHPSLFLKEKGSDKRKNNFVNKMSLTLRNKQWYLMLGLATSLPIIGLLALKGKEEKNQYLGQNYPRNKIPEGRKEFFIRSDLVIPTKSILLNRPELIDQINYRFKEENGIQTIALVGIGGAGKTTLARYYAYSLKLPIIWEINAETKETLNRSFENLAQALSKTEEEKEILRAIILNIKSPLEREEKVIQFVKERLKVYSNWLLIYDNVEKFTDIQKYFPKDPGKWGQGKVLLTTRNGNIENNTHVNSTISIGELNSRQKLSLFINILNNGGALSFTPSQREEAKKFLVEIPPFPLDVSVAAYYLKATNVSYAAYLEKIAQHNKDFVRVQENLLIEAGDYSRTRYSIIFLSLHKIINECKDFEDLFLFISLLDSQNIPRILLDGFKNKNIVDNFIYHLKKYSLIINNSFIQSLGSSLSFHRSTQEITLDHLINSLSIQKREKLIENISNILEDYINILLNKEEFTKMRSLISHCKMFLHHNFLNDISRSSIEAKLGGIYYNLDNFVKSRYLLEKNLGSLILIKDKKNYIRVAQIYFCLGNVYKELGNYEKAKIFLNKGLTFCKDHIPENYHEIARGLLYLGNVYRYLKEYDKAKETLEQSLSIYKCQISAKHIETFWVLSYLGVIYSDLGDYEKAKEALEQSLAAYEKHYGEDHVNTARVLRNLGQVHFHQKQFKIAEEFFIKALSIFQKNKHSDSYRVFESLAEVYLIKSLNAERKEQMQQAKNLKFQAIEFLKQALEIAKIHFPEDSPHIRKIRSKLGY
jgi:tetratricopeptide (TPR) repeat protein/DNA-binding CsgD family transcriptional regulator